MFPKTLQNIDDVIATTNGYPINVINALIKNCGLVIIGMSSHQSGEHPHSLNWGSPAISNGKSDVITYAKSSCKGSIS